MRGTRIRVSTLIPAPPSAVCAALLDPQVHARTASGRERVVAGDSPLRLGDEVTFEATHFGIRQRLAARITLLEAPHAFEDTMTKGAFRRLWHRHEFHPEAGGTRMVDLMEFASPLGGLFDRLVLAPYLRRFLVCRGKAVGRLLGANSLVWPGASTTPSAREESNPNDGKYSRKPNGKS